MYSVTLLVILLAVFNQASSMPDHVYLLQEASGNNTFECGDLPEKVPGDPYDCDSTPAGDDYEVKFPKLYAGNTTNVFHAHKLLKDHQLKNLTADCTRKVSQAICNVAIPVCHKDKKKIVSFLNKETCKEIAKCLEGKAQQDLIDQAHAECLAAPDKTAKTFTYAEAFTSSTKMSTTSSTNSGTKIFCAIPIIVLSFITLAF